jgi:hypothetical protein
MATILIETRDIGLEVGRQHVEVVEGTSIVDRTGMGRMTDAMALVGENRIATSVMAMDDGVPENSQ